MKDEFKLNIRLGNAAMQTGYDVAQALRDIADSVERTHGNIEERRIRDANGNGVGEYSMTLPTKEK